MSRLPTFPQQFIDSLKFSPQGTPHYKETYETYKYYSSHNEIEHKKRDRSFCVEGDSSIYESIYSSGSLVVFVDLFELGGNEERLILDSAVHALDYMYNSHQ
jgi:hypothetical protein